MLALSKSLWFRMSCIIALLYVGIFSLILFLRAVQIIDDNSFSSALGSDDAHLPFVTMLLFFGIFFSFVIYFANSLFAGKFIHINLPRALIYMGVAGVVAPIGEYLINSAAVFFTGDPVFLYHIAPIHHGYTSLVMMALWPTYGFHFYCFHEVLAERGSKVSIGILALIMGIDGIVMETLVNVLSVVLFSANIFYYTATDLSHVSSVVILPVYATIGFFGIKLIHLIEAQKARMFYVCHIFIASGLFFLLG